MILGIGVDVVDLHRYRYYSESIPNFSTRFSSEAEMQLSETQLAGNFAAKEAFFKACPATYRARIASIEVLREADGSPTLEIRNFDSTFITFLNVHISLSNSENYVVAVVLIEKLAKQSVKQQ